MVHTGLIRELETTKEEAKLLGVHSEEFTHGVFQSIGYKEFRTFLDMPSNDRSSPQGQQVLQECTELLKRRTASYAKKQLTWIRNHLLPQFPVYKLRLSDIQMWDTEVKQKALDIVTG
jgi:tRNA dimethylallyltransferase